MESSSEVRKKIIEDYWLNKFNLTSNKFVASNELIDISTKTIKKISLPIRLIKKIRQNCQSQGLNEYGLYLTIYTFLISKYFNTNSILIASPVVHGVQGLNSENLVFYKNEIDESITLKEFVNVNIEEIKQTAKYQSLDYSELKKKFAYKNINEESLTQFGFSHLPINKINSTDFKRSLIQLYILKKDDESITVELIYSFLLEKNYYLENFLDHFKELILNLQTNLNTKLLQLEWLSPQERHQLVEEFNQTQVSFDQQATIVSLFEAQVARTPQAVAVVFQERQLTYQQLNQQANQLAHHLRAHYQLEPDQVVGLLVDRSERMLIGLLGILKAGAAYLPLDPAYPAERLSYMLADAQPRVVLSDSEYVFTLLDYYSGPLLALDIELDTLVTSVSNPELVAQAHQLAYIIYTSGSTGKPKGVMIEHQSSVNMSLSQIERFRITPNDQILQFASLGFDASVSEITLALYCGAALILITNNIIANPVSFLDYLQQKNVTVVTFPPSYLSQIGFERTNFLRVIITAGEVAQIPEDQNFNIQPFLYNAYGPTEYAVCATIHSVTKGDVQQGQIPIGRPIANTQLYVLDEHQQLLPLGISGEICISGAGLARGYLHQPQLTQEKFVNHPFRPGEKLYRTGDLGRWRADGTLEYLGRKDSQIKLRGYRIELGEIEQVLLTHPDVQQAVVLLRDQVLTAYIINKNPLTNNVIQSFLLARLPEYMTPSTFYFVESFPLNINGKVDHQALILLKEDKDWLDLIDNTSPRDEVEKSLVDIWGNVLGIQNIGIKHNFFSIGGNSLKAVKLLMVIYQELEINIDIKILFANPTIEGLSDEIKLIKLQKIQSIPLAPFKGLYHVSDAQRRMWFINKFDEEQVSYHMIGLSVLEGDLNVLALQRAVESVTERHESLRTKFTNQDGEPYQQILSIDQVKIYNIFNFLDLREKNEPEEEAGRLVEIGIRNKFDLQAGPLFRVNLFQVENDKFVFLCVLHHIISDGWSMQILKWELQNLYGIYRRKDGNQLPPLKIQFKDYAEWQKKLLTNEVLEPHKLYWKNQLKGELPVLEIPTSFPRPNVKTFTSKSFPFQLHEETWQRLQKLSKQKGVSYFTSFIASVKMLLYVYSGQNDIIVGSPVAGRNHPDLRDQIGCFLNMLPLRTILDEQESFEGLIDKLKEITFDAYSHQEYPFDRLVDELNIDRDLSRSPLFDVLVVSENFDVVDELALKEHNFDNLLIRDFPTSFSANKFDITFYFYENSKGLLVTIAYNIDLFTEEKINLMAIHFQQLLALAIQNINKPIIEHDYLTFEEKNNLTLDFNNTVVLYDKSKTLNHIFEDQVARTPHAIAVRQNGLELKYEEINAQANQLARYLRTNGVQNGQNVGIIMSRSFQMIIGLLAILKTGAVYVPIDPDYPIERQHYIIENSESHFIITDGYFPVREIVNNVTFLIIEKENYQNYESSNLNINVSSNDLAYIIYTSGSTGKPKGVMIEHTSAVNLIEWVNGKFKINTDDRLLFITSICFDLSVYDIFGILSSGGTIVIAKQEEIHDVSSLINLLINESITFWNSVPSTLTYLINELESLSDSFIQLNLRLVFLSGDWIPINLTKRARKYFPNAKFISLGGATEGTVWSNYYEVKEIKSGWSSIPYGQPIANNFFYVLNTAKKLVPAGVTGELYIGGIGVSRGYYNDENKTQIAFPADPFSNKLGGRMYKTGDLGRMMPDGNLEFLGRKDFQVKIRGYRVELGEIEQIISTHKSIKEIIVQATNNKENNNLVAYYTAHDSIDLQELKLHISRELLHYMIPTYYVQLKEFPLNTNGKIDRSALPPPQLTHLLNDSTCKQPKNQVESSLKVIWQKILNKDEVSTNSNFFEIGGHSLSASQVVARIQVEMKVNLKLRSLFLYPTIEELANEINALLWTKESINTESTSPRNQIII